MKVNSATALLRYADAVSVQGIEPFENRVGNAFGRSPFPKLKVDLKIQGIRNHYGGLGVP